MLKKRIITPIITLIIFICFWQFIDFIFNIKETLLPNPYEIITAFIEHFQSLMFNTWITMIESIFGFILGGIIGLLFATLFVYNKTAKEGIYPFTIALKATPIIAIAPVLVIWFGNGITPKIIASALVVFFPILVSAVKGLGSPSSENIDLMKSLNANKTQIFFKLRIPNSLPHIFPALKIGATFAIVGSTVAEFTGANAGIGHMIIKATYYLDTSLIFASLITISIAGILFFYIIDYLEKKIVFWQKEKI